MNGRPDGCPDPERFCISGIGVVSGHGTGGRDAALRLRDRFLLPGCTLPGELPSLAPDYSALLGSRGLRLMSRGTQSLLAASRLALDDAGLPVLPESAGTRFGVVVGTSTANAAVVADFDRTTLREGPQAVNPAVFPQTVWNSPSSQVAIRFGLHGANLTVCTGRAGGLDAILTALLLLRRGRENAVLAGGFEELSPLFRVLFESADPGVPRIPLSEGAVVLSIERLSSAQARGAVPIALLDAGPEVARDGMMARIWRIGGGEDAARSAVPADIPAVDLERAAGRSGGMAGALAASLAARGHGGPESVVAWSTTGRASTLRVMPLR